MLKHVSSPSSSAHNVKRPTAHFENSQELGLLPNNEDTSQDSIDGLDQGQVRIAPMLEGGKKEVPEDDSKSSIS